MVRFFGIVLALMVMFSAGQAYADCTNPASPPGQIYYNTTQRIFQYCSDTVWKRMNINPGTGSGGCTNPTTPEGQMVYNEDSRLLQGCAGNVFRPFTAPRSGTVSTSWRMVSNGGDAQNAHACGIRNDNTLWCWGSNGAGQLGVGSTTNLSLPTKLNDSWRFVSAGSSHSCGIKQDNSLWCWGHNGSWNGWGQLGNNDGTGTQQNSPVAVSGGGQWIYVSAGWSHTCGIRTDNSLLCWGNNANGKTGLNTTSGNTLVPTAINGGGTWIKVAVSETHSCGIRTDNTLWCWGNNANGRTGRNTAAGNTLVPTQIDGSSTYIDITAGQEHSCGIRTDGSLRCWGNNWVGMLGDNTQNQRLVPTAISGGGTWKQVSASHGQHTCAVRTDDTVRCWGFNHEGQGGNGLYEAYNMAQVALADTSPYRQISAGAPSSNGFTCGIRMDGSLRCWGANRHGQLGNGTQSYINTPMPTNATGLWRQVATGDAGSTCGIRMDSSLWCWGDNAGGQLGLGNNTARIFTPTQVSGGGQWLKVAVKQFVCGIKTDNTLWCWGSNLSGQLGRNTQYDSYNTPQAVVGGHLWKDVSTGGVSANGTTCAIRLDDTLWCWGDNAAGRTGLNTGTGQTLVPTQVAVGTTWKKISVGETHTCGIRMDDALYCWGSNDNGQIGDNSPGTNRLVPTAVSGGGTWKHVAATHAFTCAVNTSDAAYCWGSNNAGNIGDNSTNQRNIPTAVSGGYTWDMIDGGAYAWGAFNCGIRTNGSAWCWGAGEPGNLGAGNTIQSLVPIAVSGGHTWKQLSAGGANHHAYTCAIRSDDTLWCWGSNSVGQMTETPQSTASQSRATTPWCNLPEGSPGSIKYNADFNLLQYCDGGGWVGLRGGVATGMPPTLPTAGLVAHWKFDETAGSATAVDSSGNGNTGTLTNMDPNTDWVAGRVGNGLDFDGINDYVNAGSAAILDNLPLYTACAWTRSQSGSAGSFYHIATKYNTPPTVGWDFYYGGSATSRSGVGYLEPVGDTLEHNTWNHYCVTYNGSILKSYKNGVDMGGTMGPYGSGGSDAANNFIIGNDDSLSHPFRGVIDELRVYNRALSLSEIQALAAE